MTETKPLAPCGHQRPRRDGCRWCLLALDKDTRYLWAWWPDYAAKRRVSIDGLAKKRH